MMLAKRNYLISFLVLICIIEYSACEKFLNCDLSFDSTLSCCEFTIYNPSGRKCDEFDEGIKVDLSDKIPEKSNNRKLSSAETINRLNYGIKSSDFIQNFLAKYSKNINEIQSKTDDSNLQNTLRQKFISSSLKKSISNKITNQNSLHDNSLNINKNTRLEQFFKLLGIPKNEKWINLDLLDVNGNQKSGDNNGMIDSSYQVSFIRCNYTRIDGANACQMEIFNPDGHDDFANIEGKNLMKNYLETIKFE